ncbi:MAG: flagellar M-ring protein FliF [Nitrospirae bacterium]|nr:flagellar M-ring protein FliF [Candidatus Troglogloeales bacterium]MBI3598044.1 flagellar M-ring protein FliF [Candidatus Troglogloeales bacterium]
MPDFITAIIANLTAMSTGKKIAVLGTLAGALAVIAAIFFWAQAPKFELLYSNLASEDIQAIEKRLKEESVPYQFSEDKTAILVPAERVYEVRLKLASEGLPSTGGVGFELFDKSAIGVTEFVQKLNYKRALQGELARTISQFPEVSRARVHIVVPEKTLFSEQQQQARASVVIALRAGKRLSDIQLQGITHLVASSIEGLDPKEVTIVDGNGRLLSKPSETDPKMVASSSQMEYEQNLERELERKIQTMLERVVGPEKATVRVSSILNFAQVEHTEEKFDPDVQVARSEQLGEDKTTSRSESTEPSPGIGANLPTGAQGEAPRSTTATDSTKKNGITNYEINKTTTRTIEPLGTIKQLSVAVLVDGTYQTTPDATGKTTRKYIPRTAVEMGKIETVVKNAMGFSSERDDQLSVVNIPFETEAQEEEGSKFVLSDWMPLVRYVIGLALVLVLFFLVVRPIIKNLLVPSLPEAALQGGLGFAGDERATELPNKEFPPDLIAQQRVLQLSRDDPKAAAEMIKQIMGEAT